MADDKEREVKIKAEETEPDSELYRYCRFQLEQSIPGKKIPAETVNNYMARLVLLRQAF